MIKKDIRNLSFAQALYEAQFQLLKKDKRVIVLGEGVDDPKGILGSTLGLQKHFGNKRVFDTPIAENAITGIAMGAGLAGMLPIVVHMRMDFLLQAMDQIVNHAAKWRYMFGGKMSVPLVIRSIIGRGWGPGAQHSQSLQALFMHIPGLRVLMPSTPFDAKGLLISSIYSRSPVIFIEHKFLYQEKGKVPLKMYRLPLDKAVIRLKGKDITLVGISYMTQECLRAAQLLRAKGIEAEVIDLVSVKPLDMETIIRSVKKTRRLVVADTGSLTGGVGSEIAACVAQKAHHCLKAPIERVSLPDAPAPASYALEKLYYPDALSIIKVVKRLLK